MYVRPRGRTARRRGFSIRRLFVWTVVPVMIVALAGAFHMRDQLRDVIAPLVDSVAQDAVNTVSTIAAPTPLPTADPSSNRRLAEAAWQNGQFQESVRLYESIIPAVPNDVTAHYYYTLGLVMQGRISDAITASENAITASPFSSDMWAVRALTLNRAGQLTESVVSAMRAIELNPESARAHAYLSESYADLGRFSRAEQELNAALEANPDSYEARYVSGLYKWEVNYEFLAARDELQDAYDLSNGAAHIGLALARLLLYRSDIFGDASIEQGMSLLNDILDRNPDSTPILYQIGAYYRQQMGAPERAETYLRRCVTAQPTHIDCNYELGRVLERLDQPEEARLAFERVIDVLESTNPYHYYWAGYMNISALGDCSSALRYLQAGYQVVQTGIIEGGTSGIGVEALETLRNNFQDAMTPCVGANAFPTEVPDDAGEEATPEADA